MPDAFRLSLGVVLLHRGAFPQLQSRGCRLGMGLAQRWSAAGLAWMHMPGPTLSVVLLHRFAHSHKRMFAFVTSSCRGASVSWDSECCHSRC
jgi:hypothetical protein